MKEQAFPFIIKAVTEILNELNIGIDKIETQKQVDEGYEVIVNIGLTGDLKGYLLFRSRLKTAKIIVEYLFSNAGMTNEETDFGPVHKASMGELANQISARAVMLLVDKGFDCNITPPTIITAKTVNSSLTHLTEFDSSNIFGTFGKLNIYFAIKKI